MYALVDCNNFYVSCERLFDPALYGKPVVVLSNNDGCAISRSEEAKQIGVVMGAVPHLLPHSVRAQTKMLSSNYTLYGDMSDRVMKILSGFAERLEVYSIDEAFLDLGKVRGRDMQALGCEIKRTIAQEIGIPTCVGIAPTKALAKMANRFAKKHKGTIGVHTADSKETIDEMLNRCAVGDVWGIGRKYGEFLDRSGVKTAFDFTQLSEDYVRMKMSVVGLRLHTELKGMPCIKWEEDRPSKKMIGTSRSFGRLLNDKALIAEALSNFAAICAAKLRAQKCYAKALRVFINTNPHRLEDRQYFRSVTLKLSVATADTPVMIKYAMRGLDMLFREGYNYMKVGIDLVELADEQTLQLSAFVPAENRNRKKAVKCLDAINGALGKDTVRFGIQGFTRGYTGRAAHLSPRYTTRLSDIIVAKD